MFWGQVSFFFHPRFLFSLVVRPCIASSPTDVYSRQGIFGGRYGRSAGLLIRGNAVWVSRLALSSAWWSSCLTPRFSLRVMDCYALHFETIHCKVQRRSWPQIPVVGRPDAGIISIVTIIQFNAFSPDQPEVVFRIDLAVTKNRVRIQWVSESNKAKSTPLLHLIVSRCLRHNSMGGSFFLNWWYMKQ